MLKIVDLQDSISKVKKMASDRLTRGVNADEFVEIGEADGFRIYAAAGKTVRALSPDAFHENPRDVFILVLEGEIEFTFARGLKTKVEAGKCFVLPKGLMHRCFFRKMTVMIEGVYEKGL